MLTKMQLITTIAVSTLLTVVFTVCLISAAENDVSSKSRKKSNEKSSTIRVIIPLKQSSDDSSRKFALKKDVDAFDRIDVYNQYDDESIEIDEDPVSRNFSLRLKIFYREEYLDQNDRRKFTQINEIP